MLAKVVSVSFRPTTRNWSLVQKTLCLKAVKALFTSRRLLLGVVQMETFFADSALWFILHLKTDESAHRLRHPCYIFLFQILRNFLLFGPVHLIFLCLACEVSREAKNDAAADWWFDPFRKIFCLSLVAPTLKILEETNLGVKKSFFSVLYIDDDFYHLLRPSGPISLRLLDLNQRNEWRKRGSTCVYLKEQKTRSTESSIMPKLL